VRAAGARLTGALVEWGEGAFDEFRWSIADKKAVNEKAMVDVGQPPVMVRPQVRVDACALLLKGRVQLEL
jgi:hypothetical protein